MEAAAGDDTAMYRVPIGVFTPGMAMANTAGMAALTAPRDLTHSQDMLKKAGYNGERVLVMGAVDSPVTFAMAQVAADLLKKLGINVEFLSVDLGTLVQRRASKGAPGQGGWKAFTTTYEGLTMGDPATNAGLRGDGADAWYGWPASPALESLREKGFDAPDQQAQVRIAEQIQIVALTEVPFIPLGQSFWPTAIRGNLDRLIPSPSPIFWSIHKT